MAQMDSPIIKVHVMTRAQEMLSSMVKLKRGSITWPVLYYLNTVSD